MENSASGLNKTCSQPAPVSSELEKSPPPTWPPDAKSQLTGEDPGAGKDWWQEEKGAPRMRWLDRITDSIGMNSSKLQEIVEDRRDWCPASSTISRSLLEFMPIESQRVGQDLVTEQQPQPLPTKFWMGVTMSTVPSLVYSRIMTAWLLCRQKWSQEQKWELSKTQWDRRESEDLISLPPCWINARESDEYSLMIL